MIQLYPDTGVSKLYYFKIHLVPAATTSSRYRAALDLLRLYRYQAGTPLALVVGGGRPLRPDPPPPINVYEDN